MARSRLRSRRSQRGATIFVVTLVMTLLTALGIFAARAAALTEQASGYDRQSEQTHFLMEEGMLTAAAELGQQPDAIMRQPQTGTQCYGLQGTAALLPAGVTLTCRSFTFQSLASNASIAQTLAGLPSVPPITDPTIVGAGTDPSVNTPGSLGATRLSPRFYVELTDVGEVGRPMPGFQTEQNGSSFMFVQGSLGSWGEVGPWIDTSTCGATQINDSLVVSRENGRGQIVVGPIKRQ